MALHQNGHWQNLCSTENSEVGRFGVAKLADQIPRFINPPDNFETGGEFTERGVRATTWQPSAAGPVYSYWEEDGGLVDNRVLKTPSQTLWKLLIISTW